jgi:hypothetical protein
MEGLPIPGVTPLIKNVPLTAKSVRITLQIHVCFKKIQRIKCSNKSVQNPYNVENTVLHS